MQVRQRPQAHNTNLSPLTQSMQVHLDGLSNSETVELLCMHLNVATVEPSLAALVFRNSDGNPGFVELVCGIMPTVEARHPKAVQRFVSAVQCMRMMVA